jgi:hypothetical protein
VTVQEDIRMCPECGGYGYYRFDYFGNPVGEQVACLMCFGHGFLTEEND